MSSPSLFPALLFSVDFEDRCLYWSHYFTQEGIYFHRQWREDDLIRISPQRKGFLQVTVFSFPLGILHGQEKVFFQSNVGLIAERAVYTNTA